MQAIEFGGGNMKTAQKARYRREDMRPVGRILEFPDKRRKASDVQDHKKGSTG